MLVGLGGVLAKVLASGRKVANSPGRFGFRRLTGNLWTLVVEESEYVAYSDSGSKFPFIRSNIVDKKVLKLKVKYWGRISSFVKSTEQYYVGRKSKGLERSRVWGEL